MYAHDNYTPHTCGHTYFTRHEEGSEENPLHIDRSGQAFKKRERERDNLHRLLVQLLTCMSYILDLFDISTAHLPASEQQVGRMAMREVAYVILDQGALSTGIHTRTITSVRVFEAP